MRTAWVPGLSAARDVAVGGAATAIRGGLHQLVRRNLRGVWVRGDLPIGGAVWASNHHSWWDFFVAVAAMRTYRRTDVGVMMDAASIGNADLFGRFGAIGADQPRAALSMIAGGGILVLFPEGVLRSAGPLGTLRPGAHWLAARGGVPLLPVATRVVLRGQQAAEAYLDIRPAVGTTDELQQVLGEGLAGLDASLAGADPERPIPGFRCAVEGVRSWNERVAALRGRG